MEEEKNEQNQEVINEGDTVFLNELKKAIEPTLKKMNKETQAIIIGAVDREVSVKENTLFYLLIQVK